MYRWYLDAYATCTPCKIHRTCVLKHVCVMPRPSALDMTLSAFAAGRVPPERLYTASVCRGYRSISPAYRALSSKPADRRYCCLSMEHSDRWTDTQPLHRPCSAYSAGNVNNIRVSYVWLGSRVVSVLDSGLRRRRARVQIAAATL